MLFYEIFISYELIKKLFCIWQGNGSRTSEYCDRCYVYGSNDSGSKSSSDSGDSKSSSGDGLAMDVPQLGDRAMPIVVEEYIPQPGLGLRRSKRIKMMKEKVKKQESIS